LLLLNDILNISVNTGKENRCVY